MVSLAVILKMIQRKLHSILSGILKRVPFIISRAERRVLYGQDYRMHLTKPRCLASYRTGYAYERRKVTPGWQ